MDQTHPGVTCNEPHALDFTLLVCVWQGKGFLDGRVDAGERLGNLHIVAAKHAHSRTFVLSIPWTELTIGKDIADGALKEAVRQLAAAVRSGDQVDRFVLLWHEFWISINLLKRLWHPRTWSELF